MLYEPTNIIPSAMTQTGTVANAENVNIQWQVNGNSAMTMFQIDVMQNNADSTFVCSSGVVTENPTVAQGYSLPFYGKDRFGNYVQFVYQPNETWSAWSGGAISDGNSYKFRTVQFFQENGTACKVPITSNLSAGTTYYFSYSVNGVTQFVSFIVANAAYFVSGNTIYFNFSHDTGWILTNGNNSRVITDITFSVFATQPSGTLLSGAVAVSSGDTFYNQFFTVQNSASSFITRTEPTLAITPLTTTPVASATQSFTATYSQAQGDSINTVRWRLFNADDMSAPIDDTGDISTSVLFYEYNGLFDGQSYTVICTITTESGVSISAELSFSVQYEQETYTGDFSAIPICQENSNLLQWDSVENIPGVNTPEGTALVQDGQLILPENATVAWSQKTDENGELQPINFEQPWTILWKGKASFPANGWIGDFNKYRFQCSAFSHNGDLYVVAGGDAYQGVDTGQVYCFSIINNRLANQAEIIGYDFGADESYVSGVAFNATDDTLVLLLGYTYSRKIIYFSVSGEVITYSGEVMPSALGFVNMDYNEIRQVAFSPQNSNLLVVSGNSTSSPETYWLKYGLKSGNSFLSFSDIAEASGAVLGSRYISFSPDGSSLVVATTDSQSNPAKLTIQVFSVNGQTFTETIKTDFTINAQNFSSLSFDGNWLVCTFATTAVLFSVTSTTVTLVSTLLFPDTFTCRNSAFTIAKNLFIFGGYSESLADILVYKKESNSLTYVTKLSTVGDNPNWASRNPTYVATVSFNPSNTMLVAAMGQPSIVNYWSCGQVLFSIQPQNITVERTLSWINMKENGQTITSLSLEFENTTDLVLAATPSLIRAYVFRDNLYLGQVQSTVSLSQQNITATQLQGYQQCDYFAVVDGDGSNILANLTDPSFSPSWNSEQYTLDLFANFITGIDGGTGTGAGTGFRIYRRTADGTENIEIITLPSTIYKVKDYGIKSNESYIYDFYVYDANGAFMGVKSTEQSPLKRQFNRFSLLSTQYNESDKCYHVIKEYQFSCNIQDMAVSNNSNKSYAQNFTPYPTVFQSTANYASGTLQALIGFVDPKVYKYWDSTQLMDELNALSTTTNTLFLKDMKGHLWMVDVGTVQMTATQKTREMQVTISLPWTEIGDASDVSIIQTPDDEGWNSGVEVLDVELDVDVTTGVLGVSYPFPYNGTSFYLVGSTPVGSENVVNPLPSVASSPQDGVLTANKK